MFSTANRASRNNSKRRRPLLSCFNIILGLALVQAGTLLSVGFFSNHLRVEEWTAPFDYFFELEEEVGKVDDDLLEMENLIAGGTNNNTSSQAMISVDGQEETEKKSSVPIDDYFERDHIKETKVPLIVGGTDGSGTRAFVDVLGKLGVPMLVDDAGTMDVHASVMFGGKGWPPLASAVLMQMHSPNYEFKDLAETIQNASITQLGKVQFKFQKRLRNLLLKAEFKNFTTVASLASYGFKAPISMLLVPILNEVFGPLKFIHVVRDGRDVALSHNLSPVKKFYNDTFPDHEKRDEKLGKLAPVKAIQLWNNWNTDLYEWEKDHQDKNNFDFIVMRTEDLLDPAKKFEALVQLADFVGSSKSLEELCCMSRKPVIDMGHSVAGKERLRPELARYRSNTLDMERFGRESDLRDPIGDGAASFLAAAGRWDATKRAHDINSRGMERFGAHLANDKYSTRKDRLQKLVAIRKVQRERAGKIRDSLREEGSDLGHLRPKRRSSTDGWGRHEMNEEFKQWRDKHEDVYNTRRRLQGAEDIMLERRQKKRKERLPGIDEVEFERARQISRLKHRLIKAKENGNDALVSIIEEKITGTESGGFESKYGLRVGEEDFVGKASMREASKAPVSKRYGKWMEMLKDKPELLRQLNEEGARGLATFGYDPVARFLDYIPDKRNFKCNEAVKCSSTKYPY